MNAFPPKAIDGTPLELYTYNIDFGHFYHICSSIEHVRQNKEVVFMKICPKCGTSYEDTARFCPICGTDASAVSMSAPSEDGGPAAAGPIFSGPAPGPAPGPAGSDFPGYGRDGSPQGSPFGNPGGPGYDRGQPYPNPNGPQNAGPGPAPYQPQGRQPYNAAPPYVSPYDHTDEYEEKDISDNKVVAMCIYLLGTIGLFIALLCQKSDYVSFHIRQSLKLTVVNTLVWICAGILSFVLSIFGVLFGAATVSTNAYYYGGVDPVHAFLSFGIGAVPLIIASICTIAIFVIRIICFIQICNGKVVEAPLVRSLNFLK